MIKELKQLLKKYQDLRKHAEYVDIGQVCNDIYYLIQKLRLKRVPKKYKE